VDVELLMEETHKHYQGKMDKLIKEIDQLKKANTKLKGENRGLRRTIGKMKENRNKQHYKNGKRGSQFNG
jgi:soluble cytochrome b562